MKEVYATGWIQNQDYVGFLKSSNVPKKYLVAMGIEPTIITIIDLEV